MKIKKRNMARLASISALGAGALGVTAGTAEASIVYTPLNGNVGVSDGWGASFHATVPGGQFSIYRSSSGARSSGTWRVKMFATGSSMAVKLANAVVGQTWGKLGGGVATTQTLGYRRAWRVTVGSVPPLSTPNGGSSGGGTPIYRTYKSHTGANGTFYKLFRFNASCGTGCSSHLDYGWLKLDQALSDTSGPDLLVLGMAYDDSGAPIKAGDTGAAPEPSTMALAGFAALALGASGLRRWRAARKPAA